MPEGPGSTPTTRLARFAPSATRYVNPLTRRVAGWMPGFALLTYQGRSTERRYHPPVNVFRHDDPFVFVLTYGESRWVKNIVAAGGCQMLHRRREVRLVDPEVIVDAEMSLIPRPVRVIGRLGQVTQVLRRRAAELSAAVDQGDFRSRVD